MPDWDAVIIGGGPAGLTAGLYLCRGGWKTLCIERESLGGYIMNTEFIENYPGFSEGVVGSQLGMEMVNQAQKYGLQTARGEVTAVQGSPNQKWVTCKDGSSYSTKVVVIAGGSTNKRLGVPGETKLQGSGVISCAFCDGGQFTGLDMAVIGGGDSGVSGAVYMAKVASKVYLIEAMPELTATAVLKDRLKSNPKIEIHTGMKVSSILGEEMVEGLEYIDKTGGKGTLKLNGVLVHVGLDPNTDYLEGVVPLDNQRQVIVNEWMETQVPGIFAAGDVRHNSPRQVCAAVGDGAAAGMGAQRFLQGLGSNGNS